jgi:hypothetical protein
LYSRWNIILALSNLHDPENARSGAKNKVCKPLVRSRPLLSPHCLRYSARVGSMFMTIPVEHLLHSQIFFHFVEEEGGLIYELRPMSNISRISTSTSAVLSQGISLNFRTSLDRDGCGRGLSVFATTSKQETYVDNDFTSCEITIPAYTYVVHDMTLGPPLGPLSGSSGSDDYCTTGANSRALL